MWDMGGNKSMKKLPINLLVFATTKIRHGRNNYYLDTFNHFLNEGNSFDIFHDRFVHIKTYPGEEKDLALCKSFFENLGFNIIVSLANIRINMTQNVADYPIYINGYKDDLKTCLGDHRLRTAPYLFWWEDDSPVIVRKDSFVNYLTYFKDVLEKDDDIYHVCINRGQQWFDPAKYSTSQHEKLLDHNVGFLFQPNLSRTRDVYNAVNLIFQNKEKLYYIHNEMCFTIAIKNVCPSPNGRFCSPVLEEAISLHLGRPGYISIEDDLKNPTY